jgi:hypothetical protein
VNSEQVNVWDETILITLKLHYYRQFLYFRGEKEENYGASITTAGFLTENHSALHLAMLSTSTTAVFY